MSSNIPVVIYVIAAIITIALYIFYENKINGSWPNYSQISSQSCICLICCSVLFIAISFNNVMGWIVLVLLLLSSSALSVSGFVNLKEEENKH